MDIQIVIFIYRAIIIGAALLIFIDYKIYVDTSKTIRRDWPVWKYLPGGAIIAYYKYRKLG